VKVLRTEIEIQAFAERIWGLLTDFASITDYHLFDRLIEAGTRLICIARPGYGESSRYVMINMAEWGDIVAVLVYWMILLKQQ
jgi:hypothetical protein